MADQGELKCLLLPVSGAGVLVPNGLVAEIVTQQAVEPAPDAAPWLLGTGTWRGVDIPLIALETLAGLSASVTEAGGRYVVLFSMQPDHTPTYYGIRIQALPRSETVNGERLETTQRNDDDSPMIAFRGRLGERDCVIPDLDRVTSAIRQELSSQ